MKLDIVTLIVAVVGVILLAIRYAHEPWTAMRIAIIGAAGRGPN